MKYDDLFDRLDEQKENVSVTEHTAKVLEELAKRGLVSEDTCDQLDE
jgi:hypothetical protein